MIDRGGELTVTAPSQLVGLESLERVLQPRPVPERDLELMRRLDELHLGAPFYGARKLAAQLRREGHAVGRRHVTTLMRRMGIEALYRKPRTSLPARGAAIYPYLLSGLAIERPNQVWACDITYLPMAHGFLYLVAILDVSSRKVLAFRLSNTLTADFCVEALDEALVEVRSARDLQHRPGRAVHERRVARSVSRTPASPSAWTAKAAGSTTCSSSGCGAA